MDEDFPEKYIKCVLLGDSCVGKTTLALRFCHEEYDRQYYPTAGVDFFLKRTVLQTNRLVRAVFWDMGGTALDSTMLPSYLCGAQVVLLVFDITNMASFTRLTDWAKKALSFVKGKPPLLALVANKCDLEYNRAVSLEKQMKFATDHGIQAAHNVSARTGENVMVAFQRILADVLGLRLSRVDQEEYQSIVKAEIVAANHNQAYAGLQTPRSSICALQ